MSDETKLDLLVVDDDDEFRDTLVRRFSRCGFAVSDAAGGDEALNMTGRREFDVAVVDMMMPGLSGLELLEKFKAGNIECEIIFLTGKGTIETAVQAMKLGAFSFLEKPVDADLLRPLLDQAIAEARRARGGDQAPG